jgi:hypothetical protein
MQAAMEFAAASLILRRRRPVAKVARVALRRS